MRCHMGCEPVGDGGGERFLLVVMPELTIYGHTINAWTQENYPEDWPLVRHTLARGIIWGCWHSQIVPDGEIGSQDPSICLDFAQITDARPVDVFRRFADAGWPDLRAYGLTTTRPLVSILVPPEDSPEGLIAAMREGTLREVWNSLEGDKDGERNEPAAAAASESAADHRQPQGDPGGARGGADDRGRSDRTAPDAQETGAGAEGTEDPA